MVNNEILVSVCSITYNHAPYIRQCLDGILMQQTNFKYEIIINDDFSTDGTTEIIQEYVEKYPEIIKPIFHDENLFSKGVRGMFANFCFPRAKGKYIAMCEGDDYWIDPLKLQKQVDFLEANPEYVMIHTSFSFLKDEDIVEEAIVEAKRNMEILNNNYSNLIAFILDNNAYRIQTMTVVFRTDIYKKIQEKRISQKEPSFMMGDTPLWVRIYTYGKIHFILDNTSVYRMHQGSLCRPKTDVDKIKFNISSLEMRIYFSKLFGIKSLYKENCKQYKKNLIKYSLLSNEPIKIFKDAFINKYNCFLFRTIILNKHVLKIIGFTRNIVRKL